MAFNLGGTLADLSWLEYTGIPLVSLHSENDPCTDIDSGVIIVPTTGDIVITDVVGSRTAAHYNTLWGNNNGFNQAGLNDTLTQMANNYNSARDSVHGLVYDGLYVFQTPAPSTTPNAFGEMPYEESSPWDWWDNTTYDMMFQALNGAPAGYGAANSLLGAPNMSDSTGNLYLDTVHGLVYDGLYVFQTPAPSTTPNAFGEMPYEESSPWDWWDNATYDAMFQALNGAPAGYGAANSLLGAPNMSDSTANLYLDTVHGYLNPRMYTVLGLGGSTTGLTELADKTTQIYPNPANDNINIVSYSQIIKDVEIYNISGQKVMSKSFNSNTIKLNTNSLSTGVYIFNIKSNDTSVKRKVIIE